MKEIIERMNNLSLSELEKLEEIVKTMIVLKKNIEELETGRTVKLHQGKRRPIIMTDDKGNLIKKFRGFSACARYIREELGILNEQNKLRKILAGEMKIEGYDFYLQKREDEE